MTENKIVNIDDAPIFKFVKPYSNDSFSKMEGIDIQDLLILIDEYYIMLRNSLELDNYITFGVEIEFENASEDNIKKKLYQSFPNWISKNDRTLSKGFEINSPILRDTVKIWQNLDKVCSIVKQYATIGENSGGHIHIGTQTLGNQKIAWLNFIKLWSTYENIIFRFSYGEFLNARKTMNEYAGPIAEQLFRYYNAFVNTDISVEAIIDSISGKRYQAVNFNNVNTKKCDLFLPDNTIEFRCPNGSLDSAIWQNNINLFINLLLYSKSASFDDDTISQRRILNIDNYDSLLWYDEIYLEQTLELCDMIFHNNLDKVNFLKQYLKSFQKCNSKNSSPIPYTLTKKIYTT